MATWVVCLLNEIALASCFCVVMSCGKTCTHGMDWKKQMQNSSHAVMECRASADTLGAALSHGHARVSARAMQTSTQQEAA